MKHEADLPRPEGSCRLVDFLTHLRPNEDPDLYTLLDRIQQRRPAFERSGSSSIGIETVSHLLSLGEHTWAHRRRSLQPTHSPSLPLASRSPQTTRTGTDCRNADGQQGHLLTPARIFFARSPSADHPQGTPG
ncbi:hypothetical protein J3R83DRAFT_290 [Lanmaoa asiatica]|nr:hypothetical protein J3R83DRAFT_290 [Lanmaoa asiatica]